MSAIQRRVSGLPLLAAALVVGVLGVQLAHGGGKFVPLRPASPCSVAAVTSSATGIDGLTERLVLLGIDGAACRLGVSREALILQLARPGARTDAQVNALRAGLLQAVDRMKAAGTLPPASDLRDEVLDRASMNGLLKAALRALPASLVDGALKTDDVLRRTINDLDLRNLLANLTSPDNLAQQLNAAVTKSVQQSLLARIRGLL